MTAAPAGAGAPAGLGTRAEPGATGPGAPALGWRALLFLLSVCMVLTFTQFWQMPLTGPDVDDPEAFGWIRSLYFPAYGAAVALVAGRPWAAARTALRQPLVWALIGCAAASVLWSVDPSTTGRRAVALVFTTVAALALAARYDWPELASVFAAAFAVVTVCCFLLGLFVPAYGRMSMIFPGAWRGVWQEKNALGDYMTVGFIVFVASAVLNPARRRLWIGFAAAAVLLVLLSTSKTSLITLVIGSACLGFVGWVRRGGAWSVAATFVAVTGLLLLGVGVALFSDAAFALLGKDATLTGRTKIWAAVLRVIAERPWTGFGYAAVWTDEARWGPLAWIVKWSGFRAHHAHNSWLETWLAMGYPGLALWAAVFAETWGRGLVAVYTRRAGYLVLPFLAVYSLTTLTESVAFIYNDLLWVIFAAIAFRLAVPDGREAAVRAAARVVPPPGVGAA